MAICLHFARWKINNPQFERLTIIQISQTEQVHMKFTVCEVNLLHITIHNSAVDLLAANLTGSSCSMSNLAEYQNFVMDYIHCYHHHSYPIIYIYAFSQGMSSFWYGEAKKSDSDNIGPCLTRRCLCLFYFNNKPITHSFLVVRCIYPLY
jgi:hypothetical protein